MIHYHGGPISDSSAAVTVYKGRHAMVSYANPGQLPLVAEVCQSFSLDNGAYSFWNSDKEVDWNGYYEWVDEWKNHPGFDFALIPDVIDGHELKNIGLLSDWPHGALNGVGCPIWHLHESLDRLVAWSRAYPRIALGSSGEYKTVGTSVWWNRMREVFNLLCDKNGRPPCKIHGLRMLDPNIYKHFPLSSADSTNVARNVNLDQRWKGTYQPPNKKSRGLILAERIEMEQSACCWEKIPFQHAFVGM